MRMRLLALGILAMGIGNASASTYFEGGNFLKPAPYPGTFALVGSAERYGVWRVIGEPGNVAYVGSGYTHRGLRSTRSSLGNLG
jgi:hypothetical protein